MTRQTSREAYAVIHASGLLSAARWAVYEHLFHHGPLTRNELDRGIAGDRPNPSYSRRLTELERQGAIRRVGERACKVTGFRSELWDVTSQVPTKLPKRVALPRAVVDRLVAELRANVEDPAAFVSRWQGRLGEVA